MLLGINQTGRGWLAHFKLGALRSCRDCKVRNRVVSWQVTRIRHDAYADAHRIATEETKSSQEQGQYLHPELFQSSQAPS